MTRQIVLDTETTGLSAEQGHRIIEIGCIEIQNRMVTGNNFHCYLDPEREIDASAQRVHGITREFLSDKPKFHEIAEALMDYIQGAELIIHNAVFDLGFLNYEFMRLGDEKYQKIESYCKITDTLKMARKKYPGQKNDLDTLCKRYQVDVSKRTLHGALLDANLSAEVYLAMTAKQIDLLADPEDFQFKDKVNNQAQFAATRQAFVLPIVTATEDELKLHEVFLEKLRKKANKEILEW